MSLRPGTRLGAYEIVGLLGAGGMGEVYRATDTRLDRQVAIKVLPEAVRAEPERTARFEREAKLLASLNHPNIAGIYGLERANDEQFIVMELVEGETLADRIARGAIPVHETLQIAKQIADALEAAHEAGVIHRDLKPANVKVRPDGTVKVLDFGLAKALAGDPLTSPAALTNSPTITSPAALTGIGVLLGTAAYMSPEQARGRAVDRRADIWAFGVVLYEMLTGQRAFDGQGVSETLARVIEREPDWAKLPATLSPALRTYINRCLQKDPRQRVQAIGDIRLALEGAFETAVAPAATPALSSSRGTRLAWLVASVAVIAAVALAVPALRYLRDAVPSESRALRVSIVHTEGTEVAAPAISPDGQRVAYRARRADGLLLLWVRDLVSGDAQSLPGTEDAAMPFWSPDSRDLGFFAGALKRVSAAGGPVRVVVENVGMFGGGGGAWGADGTIVFSDQFEVFRVPAEGGAVARVTKPPSQDWSHYWPSFLPDGRRFLFTAKLWTRTAEASEQGIYLGSLDSAMVQQLLPDLSSAVYAPPGHLVFVREGTLMAAPFDLVAGRVTGPPAAIGGAVATEPVVYFAAISASADGTLAVRPPPAVALVKTGMSMNTSQSELHLIDRSGTGSRVGTARFFAGWMAQSPVAGRALAASILDPRAGTQDLWLIDLTQDSAVPLTTTRGFAANPVWSADGRRLAYAYQPPGGLDDVYVKDVGTGQIQPVIETPTIFEHPLAWSHDERSLLVFTSDDEGTYVSSWSFASRTLTRLVGPRVLESATFSPHDDYVAFVSQQSGRPEVYVTTFPDHRQTWPITTDGATRVLSWRNDGREIVVATLSGHIAAYPVRTEGGFTHGQPAYILRDIGSLAAYSTITRDHARILIRVNPDAARDKGEMRLLFDWQGAMRQSEQ